jgi:TusA-related sulfurtransferase
MVADVPQSCPVQTPRVVDATGMPCPQPVIELAHAVNGVDVGDELLVISDDPGAQTDIPVWCRMKHQDFLGGEPGPSEWRFRVRRRS